jgi:hypothetical protein
MWVPDLQNNDTLSLSYTVKERARHRSHLARHHLFGAAALTAGRRTPRHGARNDQGWTAFRLPSTPRFLGSREAY